MEIVKVIENYGVGLVLIGIFIMLLMSLGKVLISDYQKRLNKDQNLDDFKKTIQEILEKNSNTIEANSKTIEANTLTTNHTIELLGKTVSSQAQMLEIVIGDLKGAKNTLETHDERLERVFTCIREIKLMANLLLQEQLGKEETEKANIKIKKEVELKQLREDKNGKKDR